MVAFSRLPTEYKDILGKIESVVLGFDRVGIWIDHPAPSLPSIVELSLYCRELKILPNRRMKKGSIWQTYVELFQPSTIALKMLDESLSIGRHRSQLAYVEVASDFIMKNKKHAKRICYFLLRHMIIPNLRKNKITRKVDTFYFGKRTINDGKKKNPHVVTLYADSPSKLASKYSGRACCHLEHRFTGSKILADQNIHCLADIIAFKHSEFWATKVRFFRLPGKVEIGKSLNKEKRNLSKTALITSANKFLKNAELEGVFILQMLKQSTPDFFRKYAIALDHSLLFSC